MRGKDNGARGGEILIDQLSIHGVRHVILRAGRKLSCRARRLPRQRHRRSPSAGRRARRAMMAEAVGKVTGRPGICFVTRGPGATNASAGIHIARQDSSPMIMFVGQVGRDMREREAFQELDYRAVFGTMAKWATEIDDPARIPELVSRAFYTACNGRPGPGGDRAAGGHAGRARRGRPMPRAFEPVETWPGPTDMSRLQKLAVGAQSADRAGRRQPLVGAGLRRAGALCRAFALPVATTFRRAHLFDADASCYAGDLGIGPNPKLLARVKGADLVLLIGGRLGEMPSQSYTLFDIPEPQTKLVHVHPGAEELGRVYQPASRHQRHADRVLPRRWTACSRPTRLPGAATAETAHADYLAWTENATPVPGRGQSRRDHGLAARESARRRDHHATAPAISPAGFIASTASANLAAWSGRPRARWATACRPRSAMKTLHPERTVVASPATATS